MLWYRSGEAADVVDVEVIGKVEADAVDGAVLDDAGYVVAVK